MYVRRHASPPSPPVNRFYSKCLFIACIDVLDEHLHEVLGQLNLFCQGTVRKVQHLFHLRLDLDDHNPEQCRGQLHCTEGPTEPLLFLGQGLDGVGELLYRTMGKYGGKGRE